jgi:hypothetical protein
MVVFPAPEGDDKTSIKPRRRIAGAASLNVLHLLAQSIDLDLQI